MECGSATFDDWAGVALIGEVGAVTYENSGKLTCNGVPAILLTNDSRPDLSDDNASGRDRDGVGHFVSSSIEVEDLATPVGIDEVLNGGGIIRHTI